MDATTALVLFPTDSALNETAVSQDSGGSISLTGLLALPYVALLILLCVLAVHSFMKFHRKHREKYVHRSEFAVDRLKHKYRVTLSRNAVINGVVFGRSDYVAAHNGGVTSHYVIEEVDSENRWRAFLSDYRSRYKEYDLKRPQTVPAYSSDRCDNAALANNSTSTASSSEAVNVVFSSLNHQQHARRERSSSLRDVVNYKRFSEPSPSSSYVQERPKERMLNRPDSQCRGWDANRSRPNHQFPGSLQTIPQNRGTAQFLGNPHQTKIDFQGRDPTPHC
ncbi:hypothetical protein CAPTEDRAFT_216304 [Capitella teleta]|uniref:Uncharacterized protein n=1 Tax=Capitella teleta TaxID=283909 RepID=R7UCT1_CAPTE|nr:hypothetical protein CAPTEDRAFT_216304 [Capitella teleta]|eukprot:ELU03906.1 hypothetical protein CAPTEDRAFT_216304 [Capitella teleta]